MLNVRDYLRKGFTVITIFVYTFVIMFQTVPFFPFISDVKAEEAQNKQNLSLILVDGYIYNNLKNKINWYSNYVQSVNTNTKAIVLPVNTNTIKSYDIYKIISNLYFDGQKDETSFLKSLVLIGDVPLPVVKKNNFVYSSIYPYVDIEKPVFVFDENSLYFNFSGENSNVELAHGLIKFDKIDSYKKYFDKLKKYVNNPSEFVDEKFYLDNFVSQGNNFNSSMIKYYLNKIIFGENLITNKISPLLLDYFQGQNNKSYDKLTSQYSQNNLDKSFEPVSGKFGDILGFTSEDMDKFSNVKKQYKETTSSYFKNINSIIGEIKDIENQYWKIPTLNLESSLDNFFRNYISLFGNTYGGALTDNLDATGRYNWENTVSSLNMVDVKDNISLNYMNKINQFLEQELDKKIDIERYFMYYPILESYRTQDNSNYCQDVKYENFYFGKNAKDISKLEDTHIYRGTYGNFTGTEVLNNIDSRGKKSNFSNVNNLFDTQTLSNRGYNHMIAEKDGDEFSNNCQKKLGACVDDGREYNTESIKKWANRIFGGYSPLNINTKSAKKSNGNEIEFNSKNYKQAWSPSYANSKDGSLFDLGGTNMVEKEQSTKYTDTIDGLEKYSAVWQTKYNENNGYGYRYYCRERNNSGLSKIAGKYFDYFKKTNKKYGFVDTRIKHTAPNKEQLEGFNMITKARPVDSDNYISFLGVGGDTLKLEYPNIFDVYVYEEKSGKMQLKSIDQIDKAIKDYFKYLVNDYNKKLKAQLDKKDQYYNANRLAFNKIGNKDYKPHGYNLMDENFLIEKVGEKKIANLAEMLYYMNLGWSEKPTFNKLSSELDYLYEGFDINEKISYIVENYMDTESENLVGGFNIKNSELNYPGKAKKGYEAGFIGSENLDKQDLNNVQENNLKNNLIQNQIIDGNDGILDAEESKEECGKPLGEAVMLFQWPSAFICRLQETLSKPFKISSTSVCSVGSDLSSLEDVQKDNKKRRGNEEEYYKNKGIDTYKQYNERKDYINNNFSIKTNTPVYDYETMSGNLQIQRYLNDFEINDHLKKLSISSQEFKESSKKFAGNCLYFKKDGNYINSCDGFEIDDSTWKIPFYFFNPDTLEGKYLSYRAGERILDVEFCNFEDICYTKKVIIDKTPGKIKHVEILPFSEVMVFGGENPFVVKGYDSKKSSGRYPNQVENVRYNYKLSSGLGIIRSGMSKNGKQTIDYNFSSRNKLMSVKSEQSNINGINDFNINLQLDSAWKSIYKDGDILKNAKKNIKIVKKQNLNDSEVILSDSNYQLANDPYSLIEKTKNYKTYKKDKLLKIHLEPKVDGQTLKTPLKITDKYGNFIPGKFIKTSIENKKDNETLEYEKFVKQNDFLIDSNGGIDIYLLPTYKTGPYEISIDIPGISTYKIKGELPSFEIKDIYLTLDKYRALSGEKVNGKVFGVDKFGNLQTNVDNINFTNSSGLDFSRDKNDITISGTKSGFLKAQYKSAESVVNFGVNSTFMPLDGKISIMYLTLFGHDWGKYATSIMLNSDKNLAITTTKNAPKNLVSYDYILGENLNIDSEYKTELKLKNSNTIFKLGKNFDIKYKGSIFGNVKNVESIDNINGNGIFYIKESNDDIIKSNILQDGKIKINDKNLIDFQNNIQNENISIFYNKRLSGNKSEYTIFFNKKKIGTLIFAGKNLNLDELSLSLPLKTNIINGEGTTNGIKALGVNINNSNYEGIANNTKIDIIGDDGLGFRSKFRNITNFAGGLSVGESTKAFQNEFLINYGDPFIKRISSQEVMPDIEMSETYGYKVHSDISGGIKKVESIDFNNDFLKDLVILYKNGNIRILKKYKGHDGFENLGNLMVPDKPVKDMFIGDYNGDEYEDIYIAFKDKSIRIYKNNAGEFSVDPYPICLDIANSKGMYFEYDQIFFKDMNNDKKTDIVVNDLSSNIKVNFGPTYVSDKIYKCSNNYKSTLSQKLVKSYSYEVKSNNKFMDDGYIYREGLKNQNNGTLMHEEMMEAFEQGKVDEIPGDKSIRPDNYLDKVGKAGVDKFAFQSIPSVLGPSYEKYDGKFIDFKKAKFLTGSDPVDIYKNIKDLNGGKLQAGDKVRIILNINNNSGKKITYLESLKGPFQVISKNNQPILELENIGKENIKFPSNYPNFLFYIDDVNGSFKISYEAYFQGSSSVKIKVDDFDTNKYGDIKVFLKNGCIKGYDYFKGSSGTPMKFYETFVDLSENLNKKVSSISENASTQDVLDDVDSGELDKLMDEFNLGQADNVWGSNDFAKVMGSDININVSIASDVSNIKSEVSTILDGLCKGFGFGKSDCGVIPNPCNFAFLAPGVINACGCPVGKDPGTPVFWAPGTKRVNCSNGPVPLPIPMHGAVLGTPIEKVAPTGCGPAIYMSNIRLYLAPTLSQGLGFAACFGPYQAGMNAPIAPAGTIAGNCVVTAGSIPTKTCSESDKNSADDELDDWMNDLDNGVCSKMPVKSGRYDLFGISITNASNFQKSNINPAVGNFTALNGLVNFEMNAHKINSLKDAETLMEGGMPFNLNIETGSFKGLIQCIIKKWMNKQIQFFISQLTQMTIYITYPDMSGLLQGFKEKDWSNFNFKGTNFSKVLKDFKIGTESEKASESDSEFYKTASKYLPAKEGLETLGEELSNPFDAVDEYLKDVPLINTSIKTVAIKVPWIGKDELDKQIAYLENWVERQKKLLEEWTKYIDGLDGNCTTQKCKDAYNSILKVQKFINSVQKNIEILNQYKNLPLKLYKYMHLLDFYLSQVACIVDKYVDMIVGWLNRNSEIFEKWVDAIITLINIIKTWQLLIDVSVDWKTTCGKCRVDAGDLYDCVLSGLCIDLPVLPIPPFRLPDIFIDFSHINLGIDVVLPKIKILPVSMGLFTLPDIPTPTVGTIELPELPILPAPPKLPDLPALPAMPVVELPNLPPPPKIPELMPSIKAVLEIFKIVGYFRCIIKNGIGLVAEWNVKTRIEQLTARKNRIFPFDFLNIDFPVLPFAGFDVRVDAYLKFRMELSMIYDSVKSIADSINSKTSNIIGDMLEFNLNVNDTTNLDVEDPSLDLDFEEQGFNDNKKYEFVINSEKLDVKIAKGLLYDQLNYFVSEKGEDYLNSISNDIFNRAKKLQKESIRDVKVDGNVDGVNKINDKFVELINKHKKRNNKLEDLIKKMQKGEKVDTSNEKYFIQSNDKLVANNQEETKKIVYKTKIFNADEKTKKILKNKENPKKSYLNMYGKLLNKLDKKIDEYKNGKQEKYYEYNELHKPVKNSLNIINNTINTGDISYSNNPAEDMSTNIMFDPAQNIRGLYVKDNKSVYHNVLRNKDKAQKIKDKKTYFLEDLDKDGIEDLLWYDNNFVYIKYSKDKPKKTGILETKKYIYDKVIDDISNVVDSNGYLEINNEKFKIWSDGFSINDLQLEEQNFNKVNLSWTKLNNNTNAFMLIYSSRIDIFNDIEKKYAYSDKFTYAGNDYKKYAIIYYDKRLGDIDDIKANKIRILGKNNFVNKKFIPIDFENKNKFEVEIKKDELFSPNNWKYFKVYNSFLKLNSNRLKINSSYSNQQVLGTQFIGDENGPILNLNLERAKTSKIVSTGFNLNAYLNTKYILNGDWSDNFKIKDSYILDKDSKLLEDGNSLEIGPYQEEGLKTYYFVANDYNGNTSKIKVVVNFVVPNINVLNVNENSGIVESEITHDMDNTAIKYGVEKNGKVKIIENLKGDSIFTGNENDKIFTGSVFDNSKKIVLFDMNGKEIGYLNLLNGEIFVSNNFDIYGQFQDGSLYYSVYNSNNKEIFKLQLPVKEQVKEPVFYKTDNYNIKNIDNVNLGSFNGGSCIYDENNKDCVVYISKDGMMYVPEKYETDFILDYKINENGMIISTFYDSSIVDKSSLNEKDKLFSVYYLVKNMSK